MNDKPIYQLYEHPMTEQEVREAFVAKYGYEPKEIIRKWDWLAGPVQQRSDTHG